MSRIENAILDHARYSVITRMEILGWRGHTPDTRRQTEALLYQLNEIGLLPSVVAQVIDLRCRFSVKLPDAIIAASALVENLPLMTRNTADFKRIPGLLLTNPFAP